MHNILAMQVRYFSLHEASLKNIYDKKGSWCLIEMTLQCPIDQTLRLTAPDSGVSWVLGMKPKLPTPQWVTDCWVDHVSCPHLGREVSCMDMRL